MTSACPTIGQAPSQVRSFASGVHLAAAAAPVILRMGYRFAAYVSLAAMLKAGLCRPPSYHQAAVTAEYITRVFLKCGVLHAGESVTAVSSTHMETGAIGGVVRLCLTYKLTPRRTAAAPPASIVMKVLGTQLKDVVVGSFVPLAEQEHRSYTHPGFAALLRGLQPVVYSFELSTFGMGVLLMEDLGSLRHIASRDGAKRDDLDRVLVLLAKVHSRTLNQHMDTLQKDFQFRSYLFDQLAPYNSKQALSGLWAGFLKTLPNLEKAFQRLADFETVDAILMKMNGHGVRATDSTYARAAPFSALIHGDARLDNCFFDDETKTAKFVDWQVVMPRAPMLEFGWILLDAHSDVLNLPRRCGAQWESDAALEPRREGLRTNINQMLGVYLTTLTSELTAIGYKGERPTMAYCQEMIPWVIVNDSFYIMVTIVQIIKLDPSAEHDHLVQTFRAYTLKLEWLLECLVPESFWSEIVRKK